MASTMLEQWVESHANFDDFYTIEIHHISDEYQVRLYDEYGLEGVTFTDDQEDAMHVMANMINEIKSKEKVALEKDFR